jgi:rhodanese-related sulfurtransferase
MAEHARFEKLVAEAKKNIQEISPRDAASALQQGDVLLIDVRDPDEWEKGHIPGAKNFARGTLELEIEEAAPDLSTPIITHCGGGGRSALAAESLQRMGYNNVKSMAGGFKAWKAAELPATRN